MSGPEYRKTTAFAALSFNFGILQGPVLALRYVDYQLPTCTFSFENSTLSAFSALSAALPSPFSLSLSLFLSHKDQVHFLYILQC